MLTRTFEIVLESVMMLTGNVRHFKFRLTDNQLFQFKPGQFITLHLYQNEKILRRSYSIASIHNPSRYIEFAASYVKDGKASDILFNLKPGEKLIASGPAGRLVIDQNKNPKRYILMGTGTGIVPYRSMLPGLLSRVDKQEVSVVVIHGTRCRHDLLYENEFIHAVGQHKNFTFCAYYSQEKSKNLKSYEFKGYVQTAFDNLLPDKNNDIVYLCGNPNMVDSSFQFLLNAGFEMQKIYRERYVSLKQ